MPELLQLIPDMKDITEYWIIYPHKIQVPLHKDDLLYESKRNYSSALNLGKFEERFRENSFVDSFKRCQFDDSLETSFLIDGNSIIGS